MRDTSRLRTRIALLACLPGLATTTAACAPPSTPQPVKDESEAADRVEANRNRNRERATEIVTPERREQIAADSKRLAYYEDKAREEGKTLEEVVPPGQLEAMKQQQLREKRKAEAEKMAAKKRGETPPPKVEPAPPPPSAVPQQEHETPLGPHGLFPGDPPYIDGYNPEEESCVSGNWCGSLDAASQVAVPNIEPDMGCPSRIAGGKGSEPIRNDPKTYAGLSDKPNMQGTLNQHGTELARADAGNDQMCCYHWFDYCSGRPHLGHDGPVLAPVEAGEAWTDPEARARPVEAALSPALRQRIAAQWLEDARAEHASVAAFARATLELMAVGAPPALLVQAQQAGLDEIDHARRCFTLAGRYGGEAVQPGPLPSLPPRQSSLAQLAADTFAEGCVGETIAALGATRAARVCRDPEVARSLEVIADDESRHAALAWSTVAWALREGGPGVAQRLRQVAAALRNTARVHPPADPDAGPLAAHGRLDARAQAEAAAAAWAEMIDPMLESLLAAPERPRSARV